MIERAKVGTMELVRVMLYEYWASGLINNDFSGYDEEELKEIAAWQKLNPELSCLDIDWDSIGFGYPDNGGLKGQVATYIFVVR